MIRTRVDTSSTGVNTSEHKYYMSEQEWSRVEKNRIWLKGIDAG